MNPLTILLIELGLSLGFSLTVIVLINRPLRNVLLETCGTNTRAEFWMVFTYLMLLAAPLLPVMFLSAAGSATMPTALVVIKDSLFRILVGIFFALAMIGRVIFKSIDPKTPVAAPNDQADATAEV